MANPFVSQNLRIPKQNKLSVHSSNVDIRTMLESISSPTPKCARDRLVLLLRHKYCLKPSEIAALNIGQVDLASGLIEVSGRKKTSCIILCEEDLIHFRRWITIRKLYAASSSAFIISLHWTRGRAEPYQRISIRGIFEITRNK